MNAKIISASAQLEVYTPGDHPRRAHVAPMDRDRLHSRRVILPEDPGPASAAYRMLRTQLLQRARLHKARTIGIVSAVDGEGKTMTAVNLALTLAAEPNQTILLVDLDLRRPSISSVLGLPARHGLESWLTGEQAVEDLFWRIEGIERLAVLPTITSIAGSSEVLAGAPIRDLLQELTLRYADRLLLIDLPPALLADDALTVAPLLDAVIVVATEGRTRREDLSRTRDILGSVRLLGTVLNRASESENRTY